ncbi:glycoside hydrolase family 32 protein [Paenibacillus flagellatus]|uniref:Sucrose-6-phosphate hydrolase n=1 Tax=Paenibacillus flagellatus TaxID=2211139 RepID=A0A2V5KE06_9BACL|nr:glycoside hydrolase family 32 protein [Paenibacillus flagellatus]PYI56263.1 sucrose-6-phosphate hydrolase [Paenibacillus flagellatus]
MDHDEATRQADREIAGKRDRIRSSPYRLHYHFMAPAGWMNDPNGLVFYKGEHHLFYQHNPYDSCWGPMHWGHATSRDLVRWEHQPVALAPSEPYDRGPSPSHGCFSGSAVVDGEELALIYTGHVEGKEPMQVQCLATGRGGVRFAKYAGNPVIGDVPEEGSRDFRDPKVWRHGDRWYMVVGTSKEGRGKVLLYASPDLRKWDYQGVAFESDGTQGVMWECPDLFPLGGSHVFLVSPVSDVPGKPLYWVGDMDYETGVFEPKLGSTLDYGFDFYAPQTWLDDKGRRLLIGWMQRWSDPIPSQPHGWAGALTIPRELVLEDGVLKQKPAAELAMLRSNPARLDPLAVEQPIAVAELAGQATETLIELNVRETAASVFGIRVACSEDGEERTEIRLDLRKNELTLDRERSGRGAKGVCQAPFAIDSKGRVTLHLFLDASSIELFVNDGEQVVTGRIYPAAGSNRFSLFALGGKACIDRIETWKLESVWEEDRNGS